MLSSPIFGQFHAFFFVALHKLHQVCWEIFLQNHFPISIKILALARPLLTIHVDDLKPVLCSLAVCRKMNRCYNLRPRALWNRFPSRISVYIIHLFLAFHFLLKNLTTVYYCHPYALLMSLSLMYDGGNRAVCKFFFLYSFPDVFVVLVVHKKCL